MKKTESWTHIPDNWLAAAITTQALREDLERMWKHLVDCEACRDRYWEMVERARQAQPKLIAAGVMPLPLGEMPEQMKEMINSLFGAHPPQIPMSWSEAAIKILAHVERLGESEPLTADNMDLPPDEVPVPSFGHPDPNHVQKCPQCQGLLQGLVQALKNKEKEMPEKAQLIQRVLSFFAEYSGKIKKAEETSEPVKTELTGPDSFAM